MSEPVQNQQRLRFTPNWKLSLFTLILLPLLVSLGFWQLDRAEQKRQIAADFENRLALSPVSLAALDPEEPDIAFTAVQLRGYFDNNRYFLLDNQVLDGKPGYDVLSLFKEEIKGLVLLNRGWIQGSPDRRVLPVVPRIEGLQTLEARVYVPQGGHFQLADDTYEGGWPLRVQSVNIPAFAKYIKEPLYPLELRLQPGVPGSLQANWQIINVSPAKHIGYAVQWFSMAAALLLLYLLTNTNVVAWFKMRRAG